MLRLSERYIPFKTKNRGRLVENSSAIRRKWSMPHVIGAIDGKHIRMECPKLTGSQNFNYKWFFSMVVLGIYDGNYLFVLFDLGLYGSNNNSDVLLNSLTGQMFEKIISMFLKAVQEKMCQIFRFTLLETKYCF